MEGRVPRASYPWWVKLSIWGVPGRGGLWAYFALSALAGLGCILYGLRDPRFFMGGIFALGTVPYGLSIRWIDRHGSWDDVSSK